MSDHDTGKIIWGKPGKDTDTLNAFFDELPDGAAEAIEARADRGRFRRTPERRRRSRSRERHWCPHSGGGSHEKGSDNQASSAAVRSVIRSLRVKNCLRPQ